MSKNN